MAPIEEVQLYVRDAGGNRMDVSFQELIDRKMGGKIARADLFISQTREGELLITSRQDGTIRMLVADQAARALIVFPGHCSPGHGRVRHVEAPPAAQVRRRLAQQGREQTEGGARERPVSAFW